MFLILAAAMLTYMGSAQASTAQTPVGTHGQLSVEGNRIVDQHGEVVSLAGASFFWSNDHWGGERFYRDDVVGYLQEDWGASIIRASMGVEDSGGYIQSPANNRRRVETLVDSALKRGLYVIIDWHSHRAEDHPEEAVAFFQEMAEQYGEHVNVIYEIYNEPLNTTSWPNDIKPYAERVIAAIREIDPNNLIVVGTPTWSQDIHLAAADPIEGFENIVYSFHFYAGTHTQWLRTRVLDAMNAGLAVMCTEWGTTIYDGGQPVQGVIQPIAKAESDRWMNFLREHQITHLNWVVNNKREGASIFNPSASPTAGTWTDDDLTESGLYVKEVVSSWHEVEYAQAAAFSPFIHWIQSYGIPATTDPEETLTEGSWSLLETYAFGKSPFAKNPTPTLKLEPNGDQFRLHLPSTRTDVRYKVLYSPGLETWEEVSAETGSGQAMDFTLNPDQPEGFFRIEISLEADPQ